MIQESSCLISSYQIILHTVILRDPLAKILFSALLAMSFLRLTILLQCPFQEPKEYVSTKPKRDNRRVSSLNS